ncbi:MAG: hypothetical protein HN348_10305, partial [Proteobacteria bacterium]|nr:hypothetical protein [Pseudomonadota bacterium]
MSDEFHYVRTSGVDGGVDACEGPALGLDLETILNDGLPPFKVGLEMVASICEILDIADEDGDIHGDLSPQYIFLDETGAVSIEGFGQEHPRGRAPEEELEPALTDLFGLGYVAFRLFSAFDLDELPADDPDEHDDGVVDAILRINFDDLPEAMVGDVQYYLAKLMSHHPDDRPNAVDVWRTIIAFADECPGPDFVEWCHDAVEEGHGERRDQEKAKQAMKPPDELDEEFDGPVVTSGPLKQGMDLGPGAAAKGQATAFWSKDAMKAALAAEQNVEEEEAEVHRPKIGGGAATSFWSKSQMEAMASGTAEAPRPKRKSGGTGRRNSEPIAEERAQMPPVAAPLVTPVAQQKPVTQQPIGQRPVAQQPVAQQPIAQQKPVAQQPIAQQPIAQQPIAQQPYPPPYVDDDAGGGGSKLPLIIGIVVVLLLIVVVCGGVVGAGGLAAVFGGMGMSGGTDVSDVSTKPLEVEVPD